MIIIPDIHGRTYWKDALTGNEEEKIIFLGDYTDPYTHEGIMTCEGLTQLREVIAFKKAHPDNVVLLLGNHDLSYIHDEQYPCRHDDENHDAISNLINDNLSLFNIAHEENINGTTLLLSHAGILPGWLRNNEDILGHVTLGNAAEVLNKAFHEGRLNEPLSQVSLYRGGINYWGSPVWADIEEHIDNNQQPDADDSHGIYQVFGHTQLVMGPYTTERFACLDCRRAFKIPDDEFRGF